MIIHREKDQPLVTVGIPVYNDAEYVATAIGDILAQTYPHLEIIVSDNFSIDGTEGICRGFANEDMRIRYIRQTRNIGPHENFKYLRGHASGKYFMWAASDDRWHPEFIERLVASLECDPKASVAFCPFSEIDDQGSMLPGIYRFDFGASSVVARIAKFNFERSARRDAFFYGLLRRSNADKMNLIKWWWFNKTIHMNNAYPPLSFLLATGDYKFVDFDKPLFFNRIHLNAKPRHSVKLSSWPFMVAYFAFLLRKFNQVYETEKAIYLGCGSLLTCMAVFPVLFIRLVYDCIQENHRILIAAARRFKRLIWWAK